eukprot:4617886-Pyramimonas_sp.AAC.1
MCIRDRLLVGPSLARAKESTECLRPARCVLSALEGPLEAENESGPLAPRPRALGGPRRPRGQGR